jgi:hypothetical protein
MSHPLDASLTPHAAFARLDVVVQQLIIACQTLYGGNWDDCAEDLRRRQAGQPYLYRLKLNVRDVFGWLANLKAYELARGERFVDVIDQTTAIAREQICEQSTENISKRNVTDKKVADAVPNKTAFHDVKDQY